ncbi:MAG: hypothetical protein ACOX15_03885 [Tepidanaerobacteraceae bacterium]
MRTSRCLLSMLLNSKEDKATKLELGCLADYQTTYVRRTLAWQYCAVQVGSDWYAIDDVQDDGSGNLR